MAYVYEPAGKRAAGGPTPGAVALRDVCTAAFGVTDLGIYANRPVRGGSTLSVHAEGRAWDPGVAGAQPWSVTPLVEWAIRNWEWLGVQLVIWQRRQWGGRHGPRWGPYTGVDPHTGHAHIELTRHAAATLTPARIRAVLEEVVSVAITLTPDELQQFRNMLNVFGPLVDALVEGADHKRDPSLYSLLQTITAQLADLVQRFDESEASA